MKKLTRERVVPTKGSTVVAAPNVPGALRLIATDTFDALITDLHMRNPSDGFTVVSAMRHSQPYALTLPVSGYPDVQSAMAAILL
jgi:ActR/RegA family two-component response regulator